jgi:hypothetical protein
MIWTNPSTTAESRNERDAKALWWLLMSLRFVIPAYMLYVVYLYWTVPIAPYLQGPR